MCTIKSFFNIFKQMIKVINKTENLNKIDCLDHMLHGSNITNLNHYTASLFSRCENDFFIVHAFLSNKHKQSCPKSPHPASKWGDFEQRKILWLEKLNQISPARTVTICDMMHKSNSDLHIPEHIGRN